MTASANLGAYTIGDPPGDRDEERLDRVAKAAYGSERGGSVERLLGANIGLAALGPWLPRGTRIAIPPKPSAPVDNPAYVRPWD